MFRFCINGEIWFPILCKIQQTSKSHNKMDMLYTTLSHTGCVLYIAETCVVTLTPQRHLFSYVRHFRAKSMFAKGYPPLCVPFIMGGRCSLDEGCKLSSDSSEDTTGKRLKPCVYSACFRPPKMNDYVKIQTFGVFNMRNDRQSKICVFFHQKPFLIPFWISALAVFWI